MRISDWSSDVCSSDLFQAVAKTLIGNIKEGHKVASFHDFDNLLPLREAGVHAGGVVAAGVQNHDGLLGQCLQAGQHTGEIQTMGEIGRASCRERVCQYV